MSAALRTTVRELCTARQTWHSLYRHNLYPGCRASFGTAIYPFPPAKSPNSLPGRSFGAQFTVSMRCAVEGGCHNSQQQLLSIGSSQIWRYQALRATVGSASPARPTNQNMDVRCSDFLPRKTTGTEPGCASFQQHCRSWAFAFHIIVSLASACLL